MAMTHSRAFIKADGKLLETLPKPKLGLGGQKREPVIGDNGVLGYKEAIEPGTVECQISLKQGTSLAELKRITDATITYEADTGQTYVIRHAFVTDTLMVTAGDGGVVDVKFAGDPAEEMGV
jgi:hypothetical protein